MEAYEPMSICRWKHSERPGASRATPESRFGRSERGKKRDKLVSDEYMSKKFHIITWMTSKKSMEIRSRSWGGGGGDQGRNPLRKGMGNASGRNIGNGVPHLWFGFVISSPSWSQRKKKEKKHRYGGSTYKEETSGLVLFCF